MKIIRFQNIRLNVFETFAELFTFSNNNAITNQKMLLVVGKVRVFCSAEQIFI